jgi:hypothetical protein
MSRSRSSTAVGVTTTVATELQVLDVGPEPDVRLGETTLRSLERARDPIQERGHIAGIGIRVLESRREEGSGDGSGIRVRPFRKPSQLQGVLLVEEDIDALECSSHASMLHDSARLVYMGDTPAAARYCGA